MDEARVVQKEDPVISIWGNGLSLLEEGKGEAAAACFSLES